MSQFVNISQLKIHISLSHSTGDKKNYIILSRDLLEYTGTMLTLSKYPYFSPTANYRKVNIQSLPYNKRIELFFNRNLFKKTFLSSENERIEWNEDETTPQEEEEELDEDTKKTNFELTIQALLSTDAFPRINYCQSMQYYDSSISPTPVSYDMFSLFPSKVFSYIKLNKEMHTIIGVVWLNDVINHPSYKPILESYMNYNKEKRSIPKKQKQKQEEEIYFLLEFLINEFYKTEIHFSRHSTSRYENVELFFKALNDLKISFTNQLAVESTQRFFDLSLNDISFVLEDNQDLKKRIVQRKANPLEIQKYMLLLVLSNKKFISNESTDSKNRQKEKYEHLDDMINVCMNDLNPLLKSLKEVVLDNYDMIQYLGFFGYNKFKNVWSDLYRKIYDVQVQLKTFQYVQDETDFSGDVDHEKIKREINNRFKFYSVYSSSMIQLMKTRNVSNPLWLAEASRYTLKRTYVDPSQNRLQLNELSQCYQFEENCRRKKYVESLKLNVERLLDQRFTGTNRMSSISTYGQKEGFDGKYVYEAYLNVDVLEGKLTNKNYPELSCSYFNNMLGYMASSPELNDKTNYLVSNRVFFSLKKAIEKLETEKLLLENKMNHTKSKKGGKRKHTRRKRTSSYGSS